MEKIILGLLAILFFYGCSKCVASDGCPAYMKSAVNSINVLSPLTAKGNCETIATANDATCKVEWK